MIKKLHRKMILPACFAASMLTANAQNGLNFDGTDDYVQTSYAGVLSDIDRTFEAWIFVPSDYSGGNKAILDYGTNSSSGGTRNTFVINGDGSLKFISGGGYGNISTDASVLTFGEWVHVAFVLDNGTGYLYVNGEEEASGILSGVNTPSGNDDLKIGQRVEGGSIPFNGIIDEVRIWDVARTAEAIQSTMNTELCVGTSGLVAYYKLNEGIAEGDNSSVTTAMDSAGDNNGILNGFAYSGTASNWVEGHGMVSLSDNTLTAAQTGATYQWVDCDNANAVIVGATEQSYMPEATGNYAVEITVDGCTTTSECMEVEVEALGVEDVMFANSLKLYPNPTSGNVNVTLNGVYETVDAQLVSITGKVVATYQFSNTNEFSLDLNNFNSGLYFLNLKADHLDAATVKVVKM
ncbi:LamG-like jellyroll fold domain-containing protein [Mangrovimonas sp. TPBH4]|uniref:LamG-like jellyroll fold domain-containing protein n=1 Tax=Mangrovimonas sp. TPBH4 TaxID=1645914 RepID=UPI0009E70F8E|nr:LamG-like jellyroll fold domain-containing protein [Mangrovimonas sp. TPBH4]